MSGGEVMHRAVLDDGATCSAHTRDSLGGWPLLRVDGEWPTCRMCSRRLVLFLQLRIRQEFGLPFETGSQLSVFMCPVHNEIPTLSSHHRLPEAFWSLGDGHYALLLARPGEARIAQEKEPHLHARAIRFESSVEQTETLGEIRIGSEGLKIGGVPSWAQDEELHLCCCGAPMAFLAQVPLDFPFPKEADAPEQPDSFSAEDYCLFLGNEVYIFACTSQCHEEAVWAVVQN